MADHPPEATIRVAVIGAGERSRIALHARDHGAVISAVVEPDRARHGSIRDRFGDPRIAGSVDELDPSTVDAAFVTSPDHTHAAVTIPLLRAGVAAYVEKPLEITTEAADAILAAARDGGGKVYIGHNMRHMSVVRLMRAIIARGEIGDVRAIWCRHFVGHGGDYYFKDWHAERAKSGGLLLQKGAHDIDVIHWLAGGYTDRVVAMGRLGVYGDVTSRRDNRDRRMSEWFSLENWPPTAQADLNPVIDVEDHSMMLMNLENGVQASYEQCHYTPDYWRNYTVIGTEGRLENFGDSAGGEVRVWDRRSGYRATADRTYPILGDAGGHGDADAATVAEFLAFLTTGAPTATSPLAAREAVATAAEATCSLRSGSMPRQIPKLPADLVDYFYSNQAPAG